MTLVGEVGLFDEVIEGDHAAVLQASKRCDDGWLRK